MSYALRLGDIVPADARILKGDPVEVDQSALTGESLPATRKVDEALFSGSILRQGEIDAMVYATGRRTLTSERPRSWSRKLTQSVISSVQ